MKYVIPIFLTVLFSILFSVSCKNEPEEQATTTVKQEISEKEEYGYVNWNKTSLVDTPSLNWKATVYLGEKVILLNDTAEVKNKSYVKVKLSDDTEGWMRADFIIPKREVCATTKEIQAYTRPDIMSKKSVKIDPFTVIQILEKNDNGWIKARWKSKKESWFSTSWIHRDNVVINRYEVESAYIVNNILVESNYDKKSEKYELLLSHEDYMNTRVTNSFNAYYKDIEAIKVQVVMKKVPAPIKKWAEKSLKLIEFNTEKDFIILTSSNLKNYLNSGLSSYFLINSDGYSEIGSNIMTNYYHNFVADWEDNYSDYESDIQIPKRVCIKYLMKASSRKKDFLKKMFDKYESYLYEILTSNDYEKYDIGSTVRDLLKVHDHITNQGNYSENLKKMYTRLQDNPQYWEYNSDIRSLMGSSNADNFNGDTDLFWLITFWVRRAGEGNMDVIHEILVKINQHYGDSSYGEPDYMDKCGKCGKCK